jgi:hypothetical protein
VIEVRQSETRLSDHLQIRIGPALAAAIRGEAGRLRVRTSELARMWLAERAASVPTPDAGELAHQDEATE